jgi:hypothetical protein
MARALNAQGAIWFQARVGNAAAARGGSGPACPQCLSQLVALGLDVLIACDVVTGATLDQISLVWILKQNERGPIIDRAGIAGYLPTILQ